MTRKEMLQIAALITLVFGAGFVCHWLIAGPQRASAEQTLPEPKAIRHAEEEYATGVKYESLGDFDHAMQQYENLKKAFPNHPTIDYSIGVCRQKQGKTAEALEAFRRIAAAPNAPQEIADDARARVQKLLSPTLTPAQQMDLDLADEYLRTGEDLKEQAKNTTPPFQRLPATVRTCRPAFRGPEAAKARLHSALLSLGNCIRVPRSAPRRLLRLHTVLERV